MSKRGSTETRTRIFGFKVQGANHYTIEPVVLIAVGSYVYIYMGNTNLSSFEHLFIPLILSQFADHILPVSSGIIGSTAVLEKLRTSTLFDNHLC